MLAALGWGEAGLTPLRASPASRAARPAASVPVLMTLAPHELRLGRLLMVAFLLIFLHRLISIAMSERGWQAAHAGRARGRRRRGLQLVLAPRRRRRARRA